ncbi:putative DNA binding domain-containing protein [Clostridium tagluense]|uniref:AlbA family DNA-binding domain-containing protein n=1 Tax=Clostridium tagluense TaxID=360422 RepID=UPI001CF253D6|nr:RNA-binding domain-containing protein [Clostridium tagluense]MCB2311466.1 putative DNA binding domain-containing protein [Clostridium tagluense]MCB2316190.1 putative DNA binding domain-containing protein [Clostridium tagluense]MCB2321006.1 putative DNA binding domain-containing protein [Clostridium tagluense]MCB2326023.1 putative DNA binding domain-containing protein [Clostridium tagluense]MCB2330746.1 putative DNA binding domain-containing protein [Clostridium tagluense]
MSNNDENLKEEIVNLISKGDNDRVEFRHHSGGPSLLGKIISSFANASGGRLILGANNKGRIFGCKKEDVMETFNKSKEKLIPCPIVSIEFIEIKKKILAIISIEKTEKIVSSSLGVFKRVNNSEEIMLTEEIKSKQLSAVINDEVKDTVGEMAQQISQLTITLEDTIQRYRRQNKLSRKIFEWIACGIIGIILSMIIHL